jgi:hypothetical protein
MYGVHVLKEEVILHVQLKIQYSYLSYLIQIDLEQLLSAYYLSISHIQFFVVFNYVKMVTK